MPGGAPSSSTKTEKETSCRRADIVVYVFDDVVSAHVAGIEFQLDSDK